LPAGLEKEGLAVQGNTNLFGAVVLTRSGASDLEMLVNREGFIPGDQFDFIADTVRLAIDLQVRLRYAATSEVKQARKANKIRQQQAAGSAGSGESPSAFLLRDYHSTAQRALQNARIAISAGRGQDAQVELAQVEQSLGAAAEVAGEVISESTMVRVVASLGLEHAGFVHEVRSLALESQSLAAALDRLAEQAEGSATKAGLRALAVEARELRERLRRNAVYLSDVTGIEGRRRRNRQRLAERVQRVIDFYAASISRRSIEVISDIPPELQTPPMFAAEVTAILSNLMSNAVKFAGDHGEVKISAGETEGFLVLRIENTGQSVDLASAQKWFEPFKSTTGEVDEALGQGMGLGLTLTRSLIDEYGGSIMFVSPSGRYATALQVEIPRR
jgi:signal transduction histidine kinase